jgi:hypothetical protein
MWAHFIFSCLPTAATSLFSFLHLPLAPAIQSLQSRAHQTLLFLFLKPPSSSCSCLCAPSPNLRSSCAQGRLCFTHLQGSRILPASCRAAPWRAMADTITPWRCRKLRLPQLAGSFLGTKVTICSLVRTYATSVFSRFQTVHGHEMLSITLPKASPMRNTHQMGTKLTVSVSTMILA